VDIIEAHEMDLPRKISPYLLIRNVTPNIYIYIYIFVLESYDSVEIGLTW
jgi:hypothetical protein